MESNKYSRTISFLEAQGLIKVFGLVEKEKCFKSNIGSNIHMQVRWDDIFMKWIVTIESETDLSLFTKRNVNSWLDMIN